MSVQYRSSSSAGDPAVVALTGSVPSHGHYLVGLASGTAGTEDLPTPDKTDTFAMSASAGTVFLANQTTALASPPTGSVTADSAILDLVGFGTSNTFETSATKAPSNTTSVSRTATGVDTDVNSSDFTVGTPPTPQNAGTVAPPPPGDPEPHSIAEIQGNTDTSPLAGTSVVTDGVVSASYPTGGFRGFYLQTAGTGGDLSADHDAPDAVIRLPRRRDRLPGDR